MQRKKHHRSSAGTIRTPANVNHTNADIGATISSGSFHTMGMVVSVPRTFFTRARAADRAIAPGNPP
jgi:3-polyprenyl-4-hydroxybenzoate decarboxylase